MLLVACNFEEHGVAIRNIFNYYIKHSAWIYEHQERSPAVIKEWFANKKQHNFPVVGILDHDKHLTSFASYDFLKPYLGYKYTVEHSLYVHPEYQGQGLGLKLLKWIIMNCQSNGYHCTLGLIDSKNHASNNLHQKLGFSQSGIMKEVGFKFGQWHDVIIWQKLLTPDHSR